MDSRFRGNDGDHNGPRHFLGARPAFRYRRPDHAAHPRAGIALRRHRERARLFLLHPERPARAAVRGADHTHSRLLGCRSHGEDHDALSPRAGARRRLSSQLPLSRMYPRRGPERARSRHGLKRHAPLHRARQGPPGGYRQRQAHHLHGRCPGPLRRRCADLRRDPDPETLRDAGRHRAHRENAHPFARAVARRSPGPDRRGTGGRAGDRDPRRRVRMGGPRTLRRRVAGLLGKGGPEGHPLVAAGKSGRGVPPRPLSRHPGERSRRACGGRDHPP